MRVTVYLFSKAGALISMQSFPVDGPENVAGVVSDFVPGYSDPAIWTPFKDAPVVKDDYGWSKVKHNADNGQRCLTIFYKGK